MKLWESLHDVHFYLGGGAGGRGRGGGVTCNTGFTVILYFPSHKFRSKSGICLHILSDVIPKVLVNLS